MDSNNEDYGNHGLTIIGRLLAAAAAVVFCFLLYRFANAYYLSRGSPTGVRSRGSRRTYFGLRKDLLYSAVPNGGHDYEDDSGHFEYSDDVAFGDDGQTDAGRVSLASVLDRPLPAIPGAQGKRQDKPLPPLPLGDMEPFG
jgi:hypothetical protein